MALWRRVANVFLGERVNRELDEEMEAHIEEAIARGRDPQEARRAFGSQMRHREESRDLRLIGWLDSVRADAVFAWRQLMKRKMISAAAILSLALAIGACTAAFRLIDALLLRPLPIAHAERLYSVVHQSVDPSGGTELDEYFRYPVFRKMRADVQGEAGLIAISNATQMELTYGAKLEMEKAYVGYVSGSMFGAFGLRPALGRLLTESDDVTPGAHPYAVLSYDYWTRRFGRDPTVIGRPFRLANDGMGQVSNAAQVLEIVGVAEQRFAGTEPGTVTDIFLPTMINAGVNHPAWTWFRTFALLRANVAVAPVQERLRAIFRAFQEERVKALVGQPKEVRDRIANEKLFLEPAAAGVSDLQKEYGVSLAALGVLIALVLLIACANIGNLMAAQAASRAREMALRVSIGAGRWRLVQLVLIESVWLALLAAIVGGLFAWWAAPFVVRMINPPGNPARLILPFDSRAIGFGLALTVGVTALFGLIPALRCSMVQPVSALRGGEDPRSRRRVMHSLIGVQVAFCFLVLFVSGMFAATFQQLTKQSIGFSADRVLTLVTVAETPQPPAIWDQVTEHLKTVAGVDGAALGGWALMSGIGWNSAISVNGGEPSDDVAEFLGVSPGWIDTMKIPFLDGREFSPRDVYPGVAIVNQAFARRYFNGENPIGKSFEKLEPENRLLRFQVVGLVGDARYGGMRGPMPPVAYVPFRSVDAAGTLEDKDSGTYVVRISSSNPAALVSILRHEVPRARPEFRVSDIRTQLELIQQHTIRERLLAALALFFAMVALLLAGIGLYGVLYYSVLLRRREIGIRIAVGAQASRIVRLLTAQVFAMVVVGAIAGLALGMVSVRFIESLFYQVKATDWTTMAFPWAAMLMTALIAAIAPVMQAVRIDPVSLLRAE
jgi:putative ABC transport system permease protein